MWKVALYKHAPPAAPAVVLDGVGEGGSVYVPQRCRTAAENSASGGNKTRFGFLCFCLVSVVFR